MLATAQIKGRLTVNSSHKKAGLSFLEVEKIYSIKYKPFKGFMVHLPDRDILFQKKGKRHMAGFAEEKKVPATQAYTKGEIEHVQRVHVLDIIRKNLFFGIIFFLYLRNARVISTPVFFARTRIRHVGFCFMQASVVTKKIRVNNSDL
jgi:hypothetical protein